MKVATSKEMVQLESEAYAKGCDESSFMQNAGNGVAAFVQEFIEEHRLKKTVLILAGIGNNGGDAYVAGSSLLDAGYNVSAYSSEDSQESPLCKKNKHIFIEKGGKVFNAEKLSEVNFQEGVILDGIFGTGLNRAPEGLFAKMITWANASKAPIISIDIPSGLTGDTGVVYNPTIKAKLTVALGLPKIGFFLAEGWNHVGDIKCVDFGLPKEIVDNFKTPFRIYERERSIEELPPIQRNRHKYEAGEVISLAGSPGMSGAAILTSYSVLKAGSGIVRLYHPEGMEAELSASPFELIKIPYNRDELTSLIENVNKAGVFLVGPGLGREEATGTVLKKIFDHIEVPCVIDADALFFLAEGLFKVPENAILTPHMGEMNRLLKAKDKSLTLEYLDKCQKFALGKKITLVLKGGPSFIFSPEGTIWINLTGDPGMATAGSGDVLTGIIASLLAQGMTPLSAARAGVCIHGWSGEFASKIMSPYCMTAGDIINCLPMVFLKADAH